MLGVPVRVIYSEHYKFYFFELPRTGTTSVSKALVTASIGERYRGDRHLSISEFIQAHKSFAEGYKVASCVRNPMDRVLSLYIKMTHDQNGYYSRLKDRDDKTVAMRRLLRHYELITKNQWGFEEYFLAMYKWPYTDWMYHDSKYCNYILRFENLNEDYQQFMRGVGVRVVPELPRLNETSNKENLWDSCTRTTFKRAAWVFGPYLERFGYQVPHVTGARIGKLHRTCFAVVDSLYMTLKRISGARGNRRAARTSHGIGRSEVRY